MISAFVFSAATAFGTTPTLATPAPSPATPAQPGLEWSLAQARAKQIKSVTYGLRFEIPTKRDETVRERAEITFSLASAKDPVILDDKTAASDIETVELNGAPTAYEFHDQHLILAHGLRRGMNRVVVVSHRDPASLNRQEDYLYTLFVPDRASQAFPCFDQPDLKARFELTLELPSAWAGVSNTRAIRTVTQGRQTLKFERTPLISTYLFAFAAGKFRTATETRDGRSYTAYYRESDDEKVHRNLPAIFDLHARSVKTLEEYTGLPFPFPKYDFVLLPAFQFGGMEHPGAVFYREPSLFLDASATRQQLLGRAGVIAHETSHMWFGDLVTMRWFNDVWMKEVMANFLAAKVTLPLFPDLPHDLKFYLEHQPGAADIDRSEGTNAIRQPLANLQDAGSLYGAIIYLKAPIAMNQLEHLIGASNFRAGLRTYLRKYKFANADWPDLVRVFSKVSHRNIADWSHVWIEEAGRPELSSRNEGEHLIVSQADSVGQHRLWPQRFAVASLPELSKAQDVDLESKSASAKPMTKPLLNSDGLGYGFFRLDEDVRASLPTELARIPSPIGRAVAWSSAWEECLAGRLPTEIITTMAFASLKTEASDLVLESVLARMQQLYWTFLDDQGREKIASAWETEIWRQLDQPGVATRKPALWNTLVTVARTPATLDRLEKILKRQETVPGLPLAEPDEMKLAEELALRRPKQSVTYYELEHARLANADRREEFDFLRPTLTADERTRKDFFFALKDPAKRRHEPWVKRALILLGHPLHGDTAYMVQPGLEWLRDIQRTGNIFFPMDWISGILVNRRSAAEAELVRKFLSDHPDEPSDLRGKILQASDMLFRATRIR